MNLVSDHNTLKRLYEEGSKLERKLLRGEYSGATERDALQDRLEWISNEMERMTS